MTDFEIANPFPSTPPPPPLSPAAQPPPISPSISPQRNPADVCFSCKKQGHWTRECPNKTPKKSHPSSPNSAASPSSSTATCGVRVHCPCGRGLCKTLTSGTEKNPNRSFYTCPGDETRKCGFFKWCDQLNVFKVPTCTCGYLCALYQDEGRWCFACQFRVGFGGCSFVDTADYTMRNCYVGGRIDRTSLKFNIANDLDRTEVTIGSEIEATGNVGLDKKGDSSEKFPVSTADIEQDEAQCGDPVVQGADSLDPMSGKTLQVSHENPTFQSESCHMEESWRLISASGNAITKDVIYQILGFHFYGWLGRFAFPPSQNPKDPPVMPIFCCIFPSFDPVTGPEDGAISHAEGPFLLPNSDSIAESDTTHGQNAGVLVGVSKETLERRGSTGIIQNDNGISKSVLKSFGESLLHVLESTSLPNLEAMLKVAEPIFNIFQSLSIPCDPFIEGVKEYIQNVSELSSIEKSMSKGLSTELTKVYDIEKAKFNNVSRLHTEAMDAYKDSENHVKSLEEEVSIVKARLVELQKQLSCCETERCNLKSKLDELEKDELEAVRNLEVARSNMLEARKLEQQKEKVSQSARSALETARLWIDK